MKRAYIGLATTPHDPAIAFVDDAGTVQFAEATERYLQNKRGWCSPPDDLVRMEKLLNQYCQDADEIVISSTWTQSITKGIKFIYLNRWASKLYRKAISKGYNLEPWFLGRAMATYTNVFPGANIELQNYYSGLDRKISYRSFDHHLTHAATACYSSDFDEAVCAIVDGAAEHGSTSFYRYKENRLIKLDKFPKSVASLGWFYSLLCGWCRFEHIKGEEWKVMGLAPYGALDENLRKMFHKMIVVENGSLRYGSDPVQSARRMHDYMREVNSSPLDAANLAYTGQYVFCELFTELLKHEGLQLSKNIVIGGGCALNSVWNGMVTERTSFEKCFVFSAPGDDGNALGAAMLAYMEDHPGHVRRKGVQSPYLGSDINHKALQNLEKFSALPQCRVPNTTELCDQVAALLARGNIVAWMQGRAEYGPRALGNRSILADPRSAGVKARLNDLVKFREEFRPFAPSILHEFGAEYFENYQETPYMERALRFREEVKSRVPGVVHVDGTGRLQTVKDEWNPRYAQLIRAFHQRTGVPIILNTSFNVMGKPIVHSVEDAIAVFSTSGIDVLVIDDLVIAKDPGLLDVFRRTGEYADAIA